MTKKAILFIPDISGFSEFVHNTAIKHSKHIIAELLEIVLDANTTNLHLAEIEGDALFLYKEVEDVDLDEVEAQIKDMYIAFHGHLKRYEYERICHCGACSSAYNLKLKFIIHYGEIDYIEVKTTKKPYGSDVVKAHRLLKNNIPFVEYTLLSNSILSERVKDYEERVETYDFGQITVYYNSLENLKESIPKIEPIPDDVPKHRLLKREYEVRTPALDLYETISNFDYRLLWLKGLDNLEYEKNKINRSGIKHQCLIGENKVHQITVKKEALPNQMVYGETTSQLPFTKKFNVYYIVESAGEDSSKLQIEVYADFKPLGIIMKPLMRKNIKKVLEANIKELILLAQSGTLFEG